jgi:aminoglycoside 6'-N-acetyltransferase I
MKIVLLTAVDEQAVEQAAQLLHDEFNQDKWGYSWSTMDEAREEVREMLAPTRICLAAQDDQGNVLGWIGGIPEYDGNVWELHPLVVRADQRGKGIGTALVARFEEHVAKRGGLTIMLGSDDHSNMTSLGGNDLYDQLWDKVRDIRNLRQHPYEFYEKIGYTIIGVMPDANGIGKPDIYMGKRVAR